MIGTGRILGRRPGAQLRQKRKKRDLKKTFSHFPSMIGREKRDPYAVPQQHTKEQEAKSKRVMLSNDPLVRIMIEDNSDVKYDDIKTTEGQTKRPLYNVQRRKRKGAVATAFWHLRSYLRRKFSSSSKVSFRGSFLRRSTSSAPQVFLNGGTRKSSDVSSSVSCGSFLRPLRRSKSRVSSACLWHAFRAFTVGILLITLGVTFSVLGFLDDQKAIQAKLKELNQTQEQLMYAPGVVHNDRFRLNNLSFAGPVIMGIGGFLIVATLVTTLETLDSAGKVVPTPLSSQPSCEEKSRFKGIKFRVSSSQTTFLDRNIVETVTAVSSTQTDKCKPEMMATLKHQTSHQSGSSLATTKRASFDARISRRNLEPGLALMDEIGRQALTNAFINFNRSPCDPKAYRDSLIYDGCVVSEVDNELLTVEETRSKDQLELPLVAQAIPKCPSAPDIAHNKLDPNAEIRPEVQEYIKEQAQELQSASHKQESLDTATVCGQYRVLTPTMYRTKMADTRQAQSMDYEGSRFRKDLSALRVPSPFQRPLKVMAQDSLEMELGASATGVHQISQIPLCHAQPKEESEHSDSSMVLDLHVEGAAPITLLVRDESRSTRSTSGNRETTSTTRSRSRSPVPPSPPSLGQQMSKERRLKRSSSEPSLDSQDGAGAAEGIGGDQRRSSNRTSLQLSCENLPEVFWSDETKGAIPRTKRPRNILGSQSCDDPAPAQTSPSTATQMQRWSKSLSTDLETLCFIDTDNDDSDEDHHHRVAMQPEPVLDEEEELCMEFGEDIADITNEVFATPKPKLQETTSSSSSSNGTRRHLLVRQAKVDRKEESEGNIETSKPDDESQAKTISF